MSDGSTFDEWRRANECLSTARLCLVHGLYADSISRSYYAVFHAATSTLKTVEVRTDSYRGVVTMFSLHFVRPGLVEQHFNAEIVALHDLRIDADYNTEMVFTRSQAQDAVDRAQAFLDRIHPLLTNHLEEPT